MKFTFKSRLKAGASVAAPSVAKCEGWATCFHKLIKAKASVLRDYSNLWIILPLIALGYFYYPVISFELSQHLGVLAQEMPENISKQFSISIPNLGIHENVIANVDPFNQDEYMDVLYKGVAHANTSVTPDKTGTVYLFAHSSDNPFSLQRYNTSFYGINKLKSGDQINLFYDGNLYQYAVTEKKVVGDDEIESLANSKAGQLILQTCLFDDQKARLLVYARLV